MTKSEALRLAREALTWISDVYVGEDDDAGECASCHERSYLPHAPDCKKQAALAAIDAALAEHGKLPELPKPVLESHDASDGTLRFTARSELLMVDGTGLYTADQMRSYGRACAEAAKTTAIPAGWRLVPEQLTAEMQRAFDECLRNDYQYADTYWKAMLCYAPKAPL